MLFSQQKIWEIWVFKSKMEKKQPQISQNIPVPFYYAEVKKRARNVFTDFHREILHKAVSIPPEFENYFVEKKRKNKKN